MHCIALHYITLHYITFHYITLHYITLHYITLHYITIHYITLHYITLHYITFHYITLHYITLHYITLHYITLHYITLHYITSFHMQITPTVTNGASTKSFKFSEGELKKVSFQKFFESISVCEFLEIGRKRIPCLRSGERKTPLTERHVMSRHVIVSTVEFISEAAGGSQSLTTKQVSDGCHHVRQVRGAATQDCMLEAFHPCLCITQKKPEHTVTHAAYAPSLTRVERRAGLRHGKTPKKHDHEN